MAPGRATEPGLIEALEAAFRSAGTAAGTRLAAGTRMDAAPRILSAHPLSGGSINRAFRLETSAGPFFCKWNPGGPRDMFALEREGLQALADSGTSLVVPRVVALGPRYMDSPPCPEAAASPVLVLEWLAPAAGNPGRGSGIWEALGRGLAELHRRGSESFGFPHDNYCGLTPQENGWSGDWPAFWGERRIGALARRLERAGSWGPREATVFHKLRERLPRLLSHSPKPSLLHGDLWSGNFIASHRGPALVGEGSPCIVDPAAYFGDREAEWAMLLLFGGFPEAVLDAYQESWPLPAEWRERLPLYQLYHVLNHALLFGGGYGAQALRIASRYL